MSRSHGHALKLKQQLQAEVEALLRMAPGVPCLQCEADAPDAGHLNDVGGVNNSPYYRLSPPS